MVIGIHHISPTQLFSQSNHQPNALNMKLATLVTLIGLVATAAANPIPDADTAKLEGKYPYTPPGLLKVVSWALTDFLMAYNSPQLPRRHHSRELLASVLDREVQELLQCWVHNVLGPGSWCWRWDTWVLELKKERGQMMETRV